MLLLGCILLCAFLFGCAGSHIVDPAPVTAPEPLVKQSVSPALECPKGLVDDPYHGSCGQYTDQDKNQICDYGQQ
jgi:hypothetical protein